MTQALPLERRQALHRRALWLEYFTVGWNVMEGVVAIGAGIIAGSVALVGFGVDSSIEVISAVGLLWRLRTAGPTATVQEESAAERRALYIVAATFFLLAAYIAYEAGTALAGREAPERSTVGLVLSVLSLVVMPALAYGKQRTGRELGSGRWSPTRSRPGSAPACRWPCSPVSDSTPCSAGGGPTRPVPWRCSRSSSGRAGKPSARPASTTTTMARPTLAEPTV
jgi:hypothetical protein